MQAMAWALRPLAFMDRCQRRYGEIFTLHVRRGRPWVFLTNPGHVKQVFTTDPQLMRAGAGEANPLLGPLLGYRSVMLQDEPTHMIDRRRILPSFHGERMHEYGEMMADVARREIDRWPFGEPFALWPRMQAISLEVVMRATFGDVDGERLERLRRALVELTNWVNGPRRLALLAAAGERSLTANPKFGAVMRPVEELVLEEVRRRRAEDDRAEDDSAEGNGAEGNGAGTEANGAGTEANGARTEANGAGSLSAEHQDILAMLERTQADDGAPMDDKKMRDELVTFLSDGPTATSLAWAFERLLRHPQKLARLRAEVLAGDSEEYVDAVVKETLRLCPAVPVVMRRLTQPMQLGAYTIPADTIVAPCVYLMHRRADIYPHPRAFQPERFLGESAGTYTWIPFGGGVRRCVAVVFAQLEMKRVIQTVISEVDLRPAVSRSETAARSSVSFAPDGGATVIATRRRSTPVGLPTAA
jgi:cytochrome P450 family 135